MPIYSVQGPDGRIHDVEGPPGASPEQIIAVVKQQLAAQGKPAEGYGAALAKGFTSALSSLRTGVKGLYAPEEAALEARARGEDIQRSYADQVGLDKVKEAYEKRGLLSAAGEVASQVPYALLEQAPNIAATLGGARLGAMAGAPLGPVGVIGGGILGAVVPSFLQQAGGNIERQAEEAKRRGVPLDISRTAAYGAAVPQAALDVASTLIPLGRSLVGTALGPRVAQLLEKGAEESAERLAKETLLKTLAKGTAIGALAEIPTEVTQSMLERMQAGLPLLNSEALAEYGETAYQSALLAPIGAAGRVVNRSQARDLMEQRAVRENREQRKVERLAAAEKEAQQEAYKQTGEYAFEFSKAHEALQKEYDDLGAQLKQKLPPGASFADKQAMEDVKKRRDTLKEQLQEQAAEYNRVRPLLAAYLAKSGEGRQQVLPGFTAAAPAVEEVQPESPEQLASQRQRLQMLIRQNADAQAKALAANDTEALSRIDREYAQLRQAVTNLEGRLQALGVTLPEVAAKERDALLAQRQKKQDALQKMVQQHQQEIKEFDPEKRLKLEAEIGKLDEQLQEYGVAEEPSPQQAFDFDVFPLPPRETKEAFGARVYKPGAADIEAQESAYLEEQRRSEEERLEDERRAQRLAPEVAALRRIKERPPVEIGEKDVYGPTVDRIVESIMERQLPAFTGRVVAGEGQKIVSRGDLLRAQLSYAKATNNKTRIQELQRRLAELKEPELEVLGSALELGQTAKKAGVEGRQTPETMAANRVTRMSQAQLTAFDRLADFINSARERDVPANSDRAKTLRSAAYRLRDSVVGLALNEADARMAQMGKPALTTEQQLQLVAGMERPLNELIQRGAEVFQPPVAQKAQTRGTKIVIGAKESQVGKRLFGSFPAAANTIREQVRAVIDKTTGVKERLEVKRTPYKASVLRIQFPETAKERTDAELFEQARRNASEAEDDTLTTLERYIAYAEPEVRASIMDSVRDKADGKALEFDSAARDYLEKLRRSVSDEQLQQELFYGTSERGVSRTTPQRFQKYLDSQEVAKLRKDAEAAQKQAQFMANMAAGIQARIEKEHKAAEDYVNKLTAGKAKTPIEAAQRALEKAVDKNLEAVRIADEINKRRDIERSRIASMIADLEMAQLTTKQNMFRLAAEMEAASRALMNEPKNSKLYAVAKALDKRLKKAVYVHNGALKAFPKAHANATALYNKILADHAANTVDNALIREGAKAQKRIDEARQALSDARQAEADAKRAVEAVQKEERTETEEQKRKRLLVTPSEGIKRIRVFRDTTVPSVVEATNNQRGIIAKAEEAYEEARRKKDDRGMRAASLQVEVAYRNLYRALNDAPLRQAEFATPEEIKAFEEYEDAQRAFAQAELNASFAEKGLPVPQMPPRRKLGPVTKSQSAAPTAMRTGSEESRAGLTTKGQPLASTVGVRPLTVAAETKLAAATPKSVLEQIAEKRTELQRLNKQLAFIEENKKGPVRAGKATLSPKQAAAKRTAQERKRELLDELKSLSKQQKGIIEAAATESKAQKELRRQTKTLARLKIKETGLAPEDEKPAMLRGVEVESPDLTPTQVESIKNNDVVAALEDIANDNTASELNRAVARRLSTLLEGTKIEIVDGLKDEQGKPVSGSATSKLIQLDRAYGLSQEVLLHEGVHAATERVIQADESKLTKEQLIAKRELKALFAAIQNDSNITSKNAKSSLSEFVAEALSNSNLQRQLQQKKWKLSDAWKGIKSIILRLLGIKNPETMLGATLAAVDTLMIPSNQRMLAEVPAVEHRLAQKDIAALDDGSNSMKEFAAQFPQYIKQKDRTPEDVDRIGKEYLEEIGFNPFQFLPPVDPDKLDYKSDTIMSDGKEFDENNPLHLVEATPNTFAALEAQKRSRLREEEATVIDNQRRQDMKGLVGLLSSNGAYTWPEQALVAKAAMKYAVVATPEGRLRLAEIANNNRHPIAVVSKEAANAVIEELRKGKSLKAAFLDGLQRNADENAQRNKTKNGWQKFDQVQGGLSSLEELYTQEEIDDAWSQTGYDATAFPNHDDLIEQLITDGLLPDRRPLLKTATSLNKLEQAAVDLNAACAGTSWCTGAQVSTARNQIADGDFYVYFKNGKPEVAIRMEGQNEIAEIRGNTPQQWLTLEQQNIAEDFLQTKTFEGVKDYLEETNRKNTLIRLFKNGPSVGDSKLFEDISVDAVGKSTGLPKTSKVILNKELTKLFNFTVLDGYARRLRPAPSEATLKTFEDLIRESFALDRKEGYFFHDNIDFTLDGKVYIARNPTEMSPFLKKKPFTGDPSKIKAALQITVDGKKQSLASLEEVRRLWLFQTTVEAPALLRVKDVLVFDNAVLQINDKAVVNSIKSHNLDFPTLKLTGGFHVKSVMGVNGVAKTAPYIKVENFTDSIPEQLKGYIYSTFYNAAYQKKLDSFASTPIQKLAMDANAHVDLIDGRFVIVDEKAKGVNQTKALNQLVVGLKVINDFHEALPQKTKEYLRANPSYADQYRGVKSRVYAVPARGGVGPKKVFASFELEFEAQIDALKTTATEKDFLELFKKINKEKLFSDYGRTVTLPSKLKVFETPAKIADAPPVEEFTDKPEKPRYAPVNPALRGPLEVTNKIVSQNKTWWDGVRSNNIGTNVNAFATGMFDRFEPFEKLAKYMDRLKGTQMMYFLRMYDQRMNYVAQSAGNGALDLIEVERPDGEKEFLIQSVDGANLRNTALILRDAKKFVGDVDAVGSLFTLYLAAKRAERVGFNKLDFSSQVTEQELKDAVRQIESVGELKEIFEDARAEYNEYNKNLVRFAEKAGVFTKEEADKLLSSNDYIPWYRERNGVMELWIGGETPFKLGNVKDSPHLEQLVGGDKPILDFMVSSVQNTNMMIDLALQNIAKRNAVFELVDIGGAIITPKPTAGPDVVKFKTKGKDRYAIITTERLKIGDTEINTDIPGDLVVKGMEGIPLQVTGLMRAVGFPTQVLRKFVTLNPAQMLRQVFRDSTQAYMAAGSDDLPVYNALKEIRSAAQETLTKRGITGGQVFTGTTEDISKIMRDITKGGVNTNRLIAGLEAMAADIDAGTRASQYNSYLKQGMSEMEASLLALESMNFNKRGASPSVHVANNMYAFFNAQLQGLRVLYKAMFGQLTPAERVRVKSKLITRGAMMFAASLAYAHAMQDDEAYKNASPADKYNNWFIRIPLFDEPIRIPIPFELGYIFKALPEAMYNALMAKQGPDEAKEALLTILRNVIPGASSWFVPQALKPTTEVVSGYSFFFNRPLLSDKERGLLPEFQYRDSTSELAKIFGGATGTSPIKFETLISGHFGGLGLVLLQLASLPFTPKESPEKAAKRMSDVPIIGDFFQPNDGSWILNNTFDSLSDARKTYRSFNELVNKGEIAEAKSLLDRRAGDFIRAELEGYFRREMGEFNKLETAIKASDKTPEEKRRLLDEARRAKIKLAEMVREASNKTKLLATLS